MVYRRLVSILATEMIYRRIGFISSLCNMTTVLGALLAGKTFFEYCMYPCRCAGQALCRWWHPKTSGISSHWCSCAERHQAEGLLSWDDRPVSGDISSCILVGDCNAVLDPDIDRTVGSLCNNNPDVNPFLQFIERLSMS